MYSCTTWRDGWTFLDAFICVLHWMGLIEDFHYWPDTDVAFQSVIRGKDPALLEALCLVVDDWWEIFLAYDEADATSTQWRREAHSSDEMHVAWLESVVECKYTNGRQKQSAKKALREISKRWGFVYLLGCDEGYYKIGRAKSVDQRIAKFEVIPPFDFSLIHSFEADDYYAAEAELHQDFAEQRVNGEWFTLSDADVALIKSITQYQHGGFYMQTGDEPAEARRGLDAMKKRFQQPQRAAGAEEG